jgi:hypothetical protein
LATLGESVETISGFGVETIIQGGEWHATADEMGTIASLWRYDEGSDAAIGTTITRGRCRGHANFEVELMNRVMAYYAITRFRFRATY